MAGLNLSLLAFFFGMVALLLSQLTTGRRAAAGWTSGLLILFVFLNIIVDLLYGYLDPRIRLA